MKLNKLFNQLQALQLRLARYQQGSLKGSKSIIFGLIQRIYQLQIKLRIWMARRTVRKAIINCFSQCDRISSFTMPFHLNEIKGLSDFERGYLWDHWQSIVNEMVSDNILLWGVQYPFNRRQWGDWDGYWQLAF